MFRPTLAGQTAAPAHTLLLFAAVIRCEALVHGPGHRRLVRLPQQGTEHASNISLARHLILKMSFLPRQARDKSRESTQKVIYAFSYRRAPRSTSSWAATRRARAATARRAPASRWAAPTAATSSAMSPPTRRLDSLAAPSRPRWARRPARRSKGRKVERTKGGGWKRSRQASTPRSVLRCRLRLRWAVWLGDKHESRQA
jgi:hypothetical protein